MYFSSVHPSLVRRLHLRHGVSSHQPCLTRCRPGKTYIPKLSPIFFANLIFPPSYCALPMPYPQIPSAQALFLGERISHLSMMPCPLGLPMERVDEAHRCTTGYPANQTATTQLTISSRPYPSQHVLSCPLHFKLNLNFGRTAM